MVVANKYQILVTALEEFHDRKPDERVFIAPPLIGEGLDGGQHPPQEFFMADFRQVQNAGIAGFNCGVQSIPIFLYFHLDIYWGKRLARFRKSAGVLRSSV